MSFVRTGYGLKGERGPSPAWVNGWLRTSAGWQLEVVRRQGDSWTTEPLAPTRILHTRLFEPATPGMNVLGSANRQFKIADLAGLSPLIEPRNLLGRMLPGAPLSNRHAIYVAEMTAGRLYFPALLLIERLWLWSKEAVRAILTPNSLDLYLGAAKQTNSGIEVAADPQLVSRNPPDTALQRMAWLIQSSAARRSWSSVLANAYQGRLDLALPAAAISGWMWGVELPSGFMACEIMSMRLRLRLAEPLPRFRIGKAHYLTPSKRDIEQSVSDDPLAQAGIQLSAAAPSRLAASAVTTVTNIVHASARHERKRGRP